MVALAVRMGAGRAGTGVTPDLTWKADYGGVFEPEVAFDLEGMGMPPDRILPLTPEMQDLFRAFATLRAVVVDVPYAVGAVCTPVHPYGLVSWRALPYGERHRFTSLAHSDSDWLVALGHTFARAMQRDTPSDVIKASRLSSPPS